MNGGKKIRSRRNSTQEGMQLYVCPVQVTKIAKKVLKTTPLAPRVELGMEIAMRNGFVVMAVVCGITKSVQA